MVQGGHARERESGDPQAVGAASRADAGLDDGRAREEREQQLSVVEQEELGQPRRVHDQAGGEAARRDAERPGLEARRLPPVADDPERRRDAREPQVAREPEDDCRSGERSAHDAGTEPLLEPVGKARARESRGEAEPRHRRVALGPDVLPEREGRPGERRDEERDPETPRFGAAAAPAKTDRHEREGRHHGGQHGRLRRARRRGQQAERAELAALAALRRRRGARARSPRAARSRRASSGCRRARSRGSC